MASKAYPLFLSFTLVMILLFLLSHSTVLLAEHSHPFKFIEQFKGCHRNDKVKGIGELKKYLAKLGYYYYLNYDYMSINHQIHSDDDDDDFDEVLESAIKTYQTNYHLKPTGVLDDHTVAMMMTPPRCGVADIVNGKKIIQDDGSRHLHIVSHYVVNPARKRWPDSKLNLTYAFNSSGTRSDAIAPVGRAFGIWAQHTPFRFSQTQDYPNADLKITFKSRDKGEGAPFDGPGGILAYGTPPTEGIMQFDADEKWVVAGETPPDGIDLETVALHEIGHLLGLDHSSVNEAIMFPSYHGVFRDLNGDDIAGINDLYNVRS